MVIKHINGIQRGILYHDHLVLTITVPKNKHYIKGLKHKINWFQELWFIRSPINLYCYIRSFFCCLQGFQLRYIMALYIHQTPSSLPFLCLLLHPFSTWLNATQGSFRRSFNHSSHHTQISWSSMCHQSIHHWRHNPQTTGEPHNVLPLFRNMKLGQSGVLCSPYCLPLLLYTLIAMVFVCKWSWPLYYGQFHVKMGLTTLFL